MKIVLATFGSRGDVQPIIALALALQSKGHDVLVAGPPEKASWIKQMGCRFHPLGKDVTAFIDSMENAHSIRAASHFIRFIRAEIDLILIKGGTIFFEEIFPDLGTRMMTDVDVLIQAADLDRALDVLYNMGYKHDEEYFKEYGPLGNLYIPGKYANSLELHTTLNKTETPGLIDMEAFWDESEILKDKWRAKIAHMAKGDLTDPKIVDMYHWLIDAYAMGSQDYLDIHQKIRDILFRE